MDRRSVLKLGLGVAASCAAEPLPAQLVIDAHIHLFDTRRPGGVPWRDAGGLCHAEGARQPADAGGRDHGAVLACR